MQPEQLLNERFSSLGFSAAFCRTCTEMELINLGEILALQPAEMLAKNGFNYEWLTELTEFLAQRGLLDLLQPIPGKRSGRSC